MRKYDQNLNVWEMNSSPIVSQGQQLKRLLEQQCSLEFLDRYNTFFSASFPTLQNANVVAVFIVQNEKVREDVKTKRKQDHESPNHYWELRSLGSLDHPHWQLSTRDCSNRWISLLLPEDEPLQSILEQCFILQKRLINKEKLQTIVDKE